MMTEDRMGRAEDRLASLETFTRTLSENSRFLLGKTTEEDLEELTQRVTEMEDWSGMLEAKLDRLATRVQVLEGKVLQADVGEQKTESSTCGSTVSDAEVKVAIKDFYGRPGSLTASIHDGMRTALEQFLANRSGR